MTPKITNHVDPLVVQSYAPLFAWRKELAEIDKQQSRYLIRMTISIHFITGVREVAHLAQCDNDIMGIFDSPL